MGAAAAPREGPLSAQPPRRAIKETGSAELQAKGAGHEGQYLRYRTGLHAGARVARLDEASGQALAQTTEPIKRLVAGLQALRGVAQLTALPIAAELGELGRFRGARQLMGYSALVTREYSSGKRVRRWHHHQDRQCLFAPGISGGYLALMRPNPQWARRSNAARRDWMPTSWRLPGRRNSALTGDITGWWRRASPAPRRRGGGARV